MAIYSLNLSSIGRSTHTLGTAAAHMRYILRDGACEAVLSNLIPESANNAAAWITGQERQDRINARVCDKLIVALPAELDADQRKDLVRSFCTAASGGVPWLAALHHASGRDERNRHVHIVFRDRDPTTRRRVMQTTERDACERLRAAWEDHANTALAAAGIDTRIDRRTLAAQGVTREPQLHEGPAARRVDAKSDSVGVESRARTVRRRAVRKAATVERDGVSRIVDYPAIDHGLTRLEANQRRIERELQRRSEIERQRKHEATIAAQQAEQAVLRATKARLIQELLEEEIASEADAAIKAVCAAWAGKPGSDPTRVQIHWNMPDRQTETEPCIRLVSQLRRTQVLVGERNGLHGHSAILSLPALAELIENLPAEERESLLALVTLASHASQTEAMVRDLREADRIRKAAEERAHKEAKDQQRALEERRKDIEATQALDARVRKQQAAQKAEEAAERVRVIRHALLGSSASYQDQAELQWVKGERGATHKLFGRIMEMPSVTHASFDGVNKIRLSIRELAAFVGKLPATEKVGFLALIQDAGYASRSMAARRPSDAQAAVHSAQPVEQRTVPAARSTDHVSQAGAQGGTGQGQTAGAASGRPVSESVRPTAQQAQEAEQQADRRPIGSDTVEAWLRAPGVIHVDAAGRAQFTARGTVWNGQKPSSSTGLGLHGMGKDFDSIGLTWKSGLEHSGWRSFHILVADLAMALGRLTRAAAEQWIDRLKRATAESDASLPEARAAKEESKAAFQRQTGIGVKSVMRPRKYAAAAGTAFQRQGQRTPTREPSENDLPIGYAAAEIRLRKLGVVCVNAKGIYWFVAQEAVWAGTADRELGNPGLHGLGKALDELGVTWEQELAYANWRLLRLSFPDLLNAVGKLKHGAAENWIERLGQAVIQSKANEPAARQARKRVNPSMHRGSRGRSSGIGE